MLVRSYIKIYLLIQCFPVVVKGTMQFSICFTYKGEVNKYFVVWKRIIGRIEDDEGGLEWWKKRIKEMMMMLIMLKAENKNEGIEWMEWAYGKKETCASSNLQRILFHCSWNRQYTHLYVWYNIIVYVSALWKSLYIYLFLSHLVQQ